MEYESQSDWYSEDAVENDEQIEKLEAEILESKAILRRLCLEEDLFLY